MAVTQSQLDYTQLMYIAYYGRPGDPVGLAYWADRLATEGAGEVIDFFGNSDEFQQNYGGLPSEALITGLYQQLFGRNPDPGGLSFWTGQLDNNVATLPDIALRIINGVQPGSGDDLVVANRLLVANYVTNLRGGSPLRDTILDAVTADGATVDAALAAVGITIEERERFDLSIEDGDSKVGIGVLPDPVLAGSGGIGPASLESGDLIELDALRADPRFADVDGGGYTVVVLDTGIDLDHPAFGPDANGDGVADRIVFHRDFSNDGDGTADDVQGHGSNVASIVGSSAAAYPGVAPGVNIIALQVLDNSGSGTGEGIQRALQWVVDNHSAFNIVAVNLSLGDSSNANSPVNGYAADEFAALEALGIISVAAAGNDYDSYQFQGVSYPAADPNVIAVGATFDDSYGQLSWGSAVAFDPAPDEITPFSQRSVLLSPIFAPGAIITGAAPGGGSSGSTGTSQAAPHIAGIAALAQQVADDYLGRRLTPDEFVGLLARSSVTISDSEAQNDSVVNSGGSYNRVDVLALAEAIVALGGGEPVPDPGPTDDIPGDPATTVSLALGVAVEGTIDSRGDTDWYRVDLVAGQTYSFTMNGVSLEDPWLALHGPSGARLDDNNDAAGSLNAAITFTATAGGTHFLSAEAFQATQTGTFLIEAREANVSFRDAIAGDNATTAELAVGDSLASAIDFGGDQDWVRVSLDGGVSYRFAVGGAASGGGTLADPLLELYDATSTRVAENDDGGPGLEPQLDFTPTAPGVYYVNVRAFGAGDTGSYTLSSGAVGGAGDAIPGDPSTLESLPLDGSVSSRIDSNGDADWFRISLPGGSGYVIELQGDGEDRLNDPYLELYALQDGAPTLLAVDDDGGSGLNSRLVLDPDVQGEYFLAASGFGAATGQYRLSVSAGAAGSGDSVGGVPIGDAGDSAAAATGITLDADGDVVIAGSAGFVEDALDHFSFVAPASGIASFVLSGMSADLDLVLEDAAGTVIDGAYASGSDDEALSALLDAGASYVLRVDPYRSAASDYTLSIDAAASGSQGREETINGVAVGDVAGTVDDAAVLPGAGAVTVTGSTGFASDGGDRFAFTAEGSGTASFSLGGLAADIDIALLGPGGFQLAGSYRAGSSDEQFDFPLLAGETYYLDVYPFAGASAYRLQMQLPGSGLAGPDRVNGSAVGDAGDTPETAVAAVVDASGDVFVEGSAGFDGDTGDHYRITAPADGLLDIYLFGLSDDLDLGLLDASGTLRASSIEGGSESEVVSFEVAAGENYTVWVDPYEQAASTYALLVDFPAASSGVGLDTVSGLLDWTGEAGDTLAQALEYAPDVLGDLTIAGATGFGADTADVYSVEVRAPGVLEVALSGLADDLDLALFDGSGTLLQVSEAGGSSDEFLSLPVGSGESYSVAVVPYDGAASGYTLSVDTPLPLDVPEEADDYVYGVNIGDAGGVADAHVVVDIIGGAVAIAGGIGFAGDSSDAFVYTALADGTLDVALEGLDSDADLDLRVYDATGTLLDVSESSGPFERLQVPVQDGAQYLVEVLPFSGESFYGLGIIGPAPGLMPTPTGQQVPPADVLI